MYPQGYLNGACWEEVVAVYAAGVVVARPSDDLHRAVRPLVSSAPTTSGS